MKYLFITLLILALAAPAFAQDTVKSYDKILMAGARYDDDHFAVSFGYAAPLGHGFYEFLYSDVGEPSGTFNTETAYLFQMSIIGLENLYLGPVAGPNADWVYDENASPITYITGAAGVVASYAFTDRISLGAIGKVKIDLSEENLNKTKVTAGLAFWVRL